MIKLSLVLVTVIVLKVAFGHIEQDEERLENSGIIKHKNGTKVAIYKPDAHNSLVGCRPGYVAKGIQCIPYCKPGCGKGGICIAPNLCYLKCLGDGLCDPHHCTRYKGCNCLHGYKPTKGSTYCKPHCETPCGPNELCHRGGECKCADRFTLSEKFGKCVLPCVENCLNGECNASGKCKCFSGFFLKDNVCQANCWMDCTNGHCVSENKCVCKPGYLISMPSLKCKPHCAEPCGIGSFCASPSNCKCTKEAKKNSGICVIPRVTSTRRPKCRRRGLFCAMG